jgi:5-formyltetrahydrofolate cyclo-ligase
VEETSTTGATGATGAKGALRQRILAARAALPAAELASAGAAIADVLLGLPAVRAADVVAAYVSVGSEVPTRQLIKALLERGTTVLLPVLEADNSLTWRALKSGSTLVAGRHGLQEPPAAGVRRQLSEAQVVVLPGLCYDAAGNRLGRGGGSYDRALKDLPGGITTVGIALDSDIVGMVPVDTHDKPVGIIVTPTRVIAIDDGGQ